MKPNLQMVTLTILAAVHPLSLATAKTSSQAESSAPADARYDTRAKYVDKEDVSSPNGAALAEQIGKRMSVKGELTKFHNSRIGITENEKPDIQISIDPIKLPASAQLDVKCVVKSYRPESTRVKYHYHGARDWPGNSARQQKLDQLLSGCKLGDAVEVTGTLCHITSTTTGNVATSIGYPNVPDSHFFFSTDDVTLVQSHTRRK